VDELSVAEERANSSSTAASMASVPDSVSALAVTVRSVARQRTQLESDHMTAHLKLGEAELRLGHHLSVLPELRRRPGVSGRTQSGPRPRFPRLSWRRHARPECRTWRRWFSEAWP